MSKFFINRPIVAIVIAIVTVILGVVSLVGSLPTSQFPNIVPPEILITATYPGADAKTLTQAVATPIEQQMNGVDNMIYMDSVSANNGVVRLFVDFDIKTNPDIDQVSGATPRGPGPVAASLASHRRGINRAEITHFAVNANLHQFTRRQTGPGLSHQLRSHQSSRPDRPRARSFPRAGFRRHLCAARLG